MLPDGSPVGNRRAQRRPCWATCPLRTTTQVFEEIVSALGSLGFPDGKADPALLAALKGPKAFTRAAAARALCKAGGNSSWKSVRPLLTDSDPSVRFQVALALADAHDSQAIPVVIECLSDGPPALGPRPRSIWRGLAGEWTVHGPAWKRLVSRELRRSVWADLVGKRPAADLLLREVQARTLTDEELASAEALLRKLETEQGEAGPDRVAETWWRWGRGSVRSCAAPSQQSASSPEPGRGPLAGKSSSGNFLQSPYPKRCFGCWRCADRQAPWPRCWRFCPVPRTRR